MVELVDSGNHPHQLLKVAHFLYLLDLVPEILKREGIFLDLPGKLFCLFLINNSFGFLDQGEDITHAV